MHTGEEYQPILFYQEPTGRLLVRGLNPLDNRTWRNKSTSWRVLKVFKVLAGPWEVTPLTAG